MQWRFKILVAIEKMYSPEYFLKGLSKNSVHKECEYDSGDSLLSVSLNK